MRGVFAHQNILGFLRALDHLNIVSPEHSFTSAERGWGGADVHFTSKIFLC